MNRAKMTRADREEEAQIKKSLSVNLDTVISNLTGESFSPDPSNSNQDAFSSGGRSSSGLANESGGLSIGLAGKGGVMDALVCAASAGLGENLRIPNATETLHITKTANNPSLATPKFRISANQHRALRKFPSLIDFLGQEDGEKIAQKVMAEINVILASRIQKNSHEAHEYALECKADKQNLRQYFKGDDWVCRVTVSGPFRGDEAIYYAHDSDSAHILRRSGDGYVDATQAFNVIHEVQSVSPRPLEDLEILDEND